MRALSISDRISGVLEARDWRRAARAAPGVWGERSFSTLSCHLAASEEEVSEEEEDEEEAEEEEVEESDPSTGSVTVKE